MSTSYPFTKGLHGLGNGCYGYLQPDGGWGYSNTGLIEDQGQCLLVDTLVDLPLTRNMLDVMRKAVPAAESIGTLLNTHSDSDHTFGNQLVEGAVIISSDACLAEMEYLENCSGDPRGDFRLDWQNYGDAGKFFNEVLWTRFSADGYVATLPTRTFSGEQTIRVGSKEVRFIEVGPAHTKGDVVVYVPEDKTVFAGDMLFIDSHPVVWNGPVQAWIDACDLMMSWDVDTVVPGHGPITGKQGIQGLKDYLLFVRAESRKRFDAGMAYEEASRDIDLDEYADWIDRERIVLNVYACYREFDDEIQEVDRIELLSAAGRYYFDERAEKLCRQSRLFASEKP